MRALGLDLGERRIGVAVGDSDGRVATPVTVLHRLGDQTADHRVLAELVIEWEAQVVVVGMPYSLDGTRGPAAESVTEEVARLGAALTVPVETYDERLTTVTAERSLADQGLAGRERRSVVDKVAAAVILQAWMDSRRETEDR